MLGGHEEKKKGLVFPGEGGKLAAWSLIRRWLGAVRDHDDMRVRGSWMSVCRGVIRGRLTYKSVDGGADDRK